MLKEQISNLLDLTTNLSAQDIINVQANWPAALPLMLQVKHGHKNVADITTFEWSVLNEVTDFVHKAQSIDLLHTNMWDNYTPIRESDDL